MRQLCHFARGCLPGLAANRPDRTYAFGHEAGADADDLERQTYESMVAEEISTYGFTQAAASRAHYLIEIRYGMREGTAILSQPMDPWAPWGGWGPGWRGPGFGYAFGPWWGPPPMIDTAYPVYTSFLRLRIRDRQAGREVYRVNVRHTDDAPSLVRAMPYLVRSAFYEFPMQNGTAREVRLARDPQTAGMGSAGANERIVAPAAAPATLVPAPAPARPAQAPG